jgi:hypothetical protein
VCVLIPGIELRNLKDLKFFTAMEIPHEKWNSPLRMGLRLKILVPIKRNCLYTWWEHYLVSFIKIWIRCYIFFLSPLFFFFIFFFCFFWGQLLSIWKITGFSIHLIEILK